MSVPRLSSLSLEEFSDIDPEQRKGVEKLVQALNPFLADTTGLLNRRLVLGDNVAAVFKQVEVTQPDDWTTLSLLNSFQQRSDADFPKAPAWRKANGEIILRGLIERPAGAPAANTDIAQFGVEARPETGHSFSPKASTTGTELTIKTNGEFEWRNGGVVFIFLDGIRWTAKDRTDKTPGKPYPLTVFTPELPSRPRAVFVVKCEDITDKKVVPVMAPNLSWEPTTKDQQAGISILALSGLSPNRKYKVTVLAIL